MVQNLELEEFLEEQPTQVDQTPEPAAEAQVSEEQVSEEQEEVSKQAPQVPEKPKSKKNMLNLFLPVLTVLLLLVGVCEAAFWGWFGFTSYRQNLARQRYEQQLADLEEERLAKGITGGSAYGPWRKVENGTVTWSGRSSSPTAAARRTAAPPRRRHPHGCPHCQCLLFPTFWRNRSGLHPKRSSPRNRTQAERACSTAVLTHF